MSRLVRALRFACAAATATICLIGAAAAQSDYPTHPIRLIVPFAPGGSTDAQARIIAEHLGRELGQQIAVVNVGGAAARWASRKPPKPRRTAIRS
jgi:tripartite-type tricarboxylate transporter receptor subunit TctC